MNSRQAGKQYAVTVEGTRAVAQAALKAGVRRLVHTSSVAALGVPETDRPSLLNEDHTWNFPPQRYPYGYAKYLAELEIQKAVAQGLDAVIVNPSLVIGPGDVYRQASSPIVMVAQRKLNLAVEGGINIVHIDDVINGQMAALERGQSGQRYILAGENLTILAMLQCAARAAGVPPINLVLPAGVVRAAAGPAALFSSFMNLPISSDMLFLAGKHFYYDTAKAAAALGLPAPRPAEEAIRAALDWFTRK
jgi:dihydroflavonol-4-reductase